MKRIAIVTLVSFFLTAPALLATDQLFFNLEVLDNSKGGTPTEVKLRVPLSLIEAMGPAVQKALDDAEINEHFDLVRNAWTEIKAAGPFKMVEVNSEEGKVTVATTGTHISINGSDMAHGVFKILVPMKLGDLIFENDGVLDFHGLLEELSQMKGMDLILVEAEKTNVRAWIE